MLGSPRLVYHFCWQPAADLDQHGDDVEMDIKQCKAKLTCTINAAPSFRAALYDQTLDQTQYDAIVGFKGAEMSSVSSSSVDVPRGCTTGQSTTVVWSSIDSSSVDISKGVGLTSVHCASAAVGGAH